MNQLSFKITVLYKFLTNNKFLTMKLKLYLLIFKIINIILMIMIIIEFIKIYFIKI